MYGWYYDPTVILVFAGLILTMIASAGVKSTFAKYSRVRCMAGYTGAQAAQEVLNRSGIYDVRIERVAGELTDTMIRDPKYCVFLTVPTHPIRLQQYVWQPMSAVMRSSIRKDMGRWCFEVHWFRQPILVRAFPGRFLLQD